MPPHDAAAPVVLRGDDDSDHDGVPLREDLCPDAPEDCDGRQDEDGCPDPDDDGDRVVDACDRCPTEPEVYNGFQDEDGCPDRGMVLLIDQHLRILTELHFARGRAALGPEAAPLLDAVGATLAGHAEILEVELRGHAAREERDPDALGLARANAVRDALLARGIAAERLTVRSVGVTQPQVPQNTADGRARQRRVSFEILRMEEDPAERPRAPGPPPQGFVVDSSQRCLDGRPAYVPPPGACAPRAPVATDAGNSG